MADDPDLAEMLDHFASLSPSDRARVMKMLGPSGREGLQALMTDEDDRLSPSLRALIAAPDISSRLTPRAADALKQAELRE
jgi:hypothetical protein